MTVMTIARLTARHQEPYVVARPTDLEDLKLYMKNLSGSTVPTLEETITAQWLHFELKDCVVQIIICDPFRSRLLCDEPQTDKTGAAHLCDILPFRQLHLRLTQHRNDLLRRVLLLAHPFCPPSTDPNAI